MYDLTKVQDISSPDELIDAIRTLYDPELQLTDITVSEYKFKIKAVAKKLGLAGAASEMLKAYEKTFKSTSGNGSETSSTAEDENEWVPQVITKCRLNERGFVMNEIFNYTTIFENDPAYSTVRMNELTNRPEIFRTDEQKLDLWNNTDDSNSRGYVQRYYNIHNKEMHEDGFKRFLKSRRYHPIKETIEAIKWDGVSRIPYILSRWMGVEDNEYTREVSRLIFAGGINRLYHPGCKFDDMAVLIGGQGAGKSTFVRWLALEDRFYSELTTTDDKKGGELVEGSWVMEVSELLALTRTKEQEEVKAFLSRTKDRFRSAYAPRVEERPRTCIFIGTSNREQFITDKTGGRRFYPVYCTADGEDFGQCEVEFKEYASQCWAEALAKINTSFMTPYAKREVRGFIKEAQENAMEDDYRIGMIRAYFDKHKGERICTMTLWREALGIENKEPTLSEQTQIGMIVSQNFKDWKKERRKGQLTKYKQERAWEYIGKDTTPTYSTPNDYTPFDLC